MKKKPSWLVTANSGIARIYRVEKENSLAEIHLLEHPESRMHNLDLVSDKPGRDFESFGAVRHAVGKCETPKMHEFSVFADELACFIKKAHDQGEFDQLYIAASPNFLGLLRASLDPTIVKLIAGEADKDMTQTNPSEISQSLSFILR